MTTCILVKTALTISLRAKGEKSYLDYYLEKYGFKYYYQYIALFLGFCIISYAVFEFARDLPMIYEGKKVLNYSFIYTSFVLIIVIASIVLDTFFYPNFRTLLRVLPLSRYYLFNIGILLNLIDYKLLVYLSFLGNICFWSFTPYLNKTVSIALGATLSVLYLIVGTLLSVLENRKVNSDFLKLKITKAIAALLTLLAVILVKKGILNKEIFERGFSEVWSVFLYTVLLAILSYLISYYIYFKRK